MAVNFYDGVVWTSIDSGTNWTPNSAGYNTHWTGAASSADGTHLVACPASDGDYFLVTSSDSGATWTPRDASRNWFAVASSADGSKLAAVVYGGQIYISADYGVTWAPTGSVQNYGAVASSADGTSLIASSRSGQLYLSADSGLTWTPRGSSNTWAGVASSADGTKLVAVVNGGQIYTSGQTTLLLTNPPTILGVSVSAVEANVSGGAVVIFAITATNCCQPNVPVTCTPSSGSVFPVGTNTVSCVAVDAFGVTNTASFTVTVTLPASPVFGGCSIIGPLHLFICKPRACRVRPTRSRLPLTWWTGWIITTSPPTRTD